MRPEILLILCLLILEATGALNSLNRSLHIEKRAVFTVLLGVLAYSTFEITFFTGLTINMASIFLFVLFAFGLDGAKGLNLLKSLFLISTLTGLLLAFVLFQISTSAGLLEGILIGLLAGIMGNCLRHCFSAIVVSQFLTECLMALFCFLQEGYLNLTIGMNPSLAIQLVAMCTSALLQMIKQRVGIVSSQKSL